MVRALPRRWSAALAATAALVTGFVAPAHAAGASIRIGSSTAAVLVGHTFTLSGSVTPAAAGVTLTRQVYRHSTWQTTGTAVSQASGAWRMLVTAPSTPEQLRLRVYATLGGSRVVSPVVRVDAVDRLPAAATPTEAAGDASAPASTATSSAAAIVTPTASTSANGSVAGSASLETAAFTAGGSAELAKATFLTSAQLAANIARLRAQMTLLRKQLTKPPAKPPAKPTQPKADPKPSPIPTPTPTVAGDTTTAVDTSTPTPPNPNGYVSAYGPGKRILGADISMYQHPGNQPINFAQMYKGGVRFVFIKASDGRDTGHNGAATWYAQDRAGAQAAGIYTGFYHYAYFPDTTNKAAIVADAQAQAAKAIGRLAAVGGYNAMDLPYALDVEEWCFATNDNGSCLRRVSTANATLWVKTWLATMTQRTGRKPFVYSSAWFLENILDRDATLGELRTYPLWIAHAGLKPADPTNYPGMKQPFGCFITAWTLANCQPQWSVWQYTIATNDAKYGIPGGHLDLDLFSGSSNDLHSLTTGVWQPTPGDFLPVNESTTATVSNLAYSLTTLPLTFTVDVTRITGGPVVSGTVGFQLLTDATGVPATPAQQGAVRAKVNRIASGTWTVSVTGLPAGTWIGQVRFSDASGVHAPSSAPILFTLTAPIPVPDTSTATTSDTATVGTSSDTTTVTATPAPTPSPTATP